MSLLQDFSVRVDPHRAGDALIWSRGDTPVLALAQAATIETGPRDPHDVRGMAHSCGYATTRRVGERITGAVEMDADTARYEVDDVCERVGRATWRVDRRITATSARAGTGVRLILELVPLLADRSYDDFRYFAPPALYDLNDLNQDGVEDYLGTRSLHFRDDRLNLVALLAYSPSAKLGIVLARAEAPRFDALPPRATGENALLQRTDIGSLGIEPTGDGGVSLVAAYPFAERTRSHALLVKERVPFGAFTEIAEGELLEVSYLIRFIQAEDVHDALWSAWRGRYADLAPVPVALASPLADIAALRVEATLPYFIEETDGARAAGFVTNCHPQDGRQLSNVIQFGFTGQNNLNAFNLLRAALRQEDPERRRKALRVMDFFAETALRSPIGLVPGYYNADTRTFGNWWTGLILPLAYAGPGGDLERLMGPLYGHLREVIEALDGRDGIYLRCVAEEYDALLAALRHERGAGDDHPAWLAASERFAAFLLDAQEADGSWFRAYAPDGEPITEPVTWFGQTEVQQKSSTATVVPFLLALHGVAPDERLLEAARKACRFVETRIVDAIKFNGGIHDSIYAKPQLVDGESIMFAMRALLELHRATGGQPWLDGARRAAQIVVTWTCLWDVPLPEASTLARHGFRSTGWMACDAPGAGYIHPMGVVAIPDLVEIGMLTGEPLFLKAAELLQAGCNETVETPARSWGYARPGLQEEGLLVSWWFADDPMFADTGFGGRGKGEGNKTCLPWISAVGAHAHEDMIARFGTTDIATLLERL